MILGCVSSPISLLSCNIHVFLTICFAFSIGYPGYPGVAKDGIPGLQGPPGYTGPQGQQGLPGQAGVPGFCEARDCGISAPSMLGEQGLRKVF